MKTEIKSRKMSRTLVCHESKKDVMKNVTKNPFSDIFTKGKQKVNNGEYYRSNESNSWVMKMMSRISCNERGVYDGK